eukprot:CAMPEP_0173172786 /NCGR_PEP_ID=MMETSP1141-20130122/2493_1 /TAXON_ID=483371 /ORGANISM="non described non described, Strain CCMP2298" /LENGTH=114 /DNA_ID=CAMNT_0014094843 /DNA_START=385 /DNA_END=729 /DNA_ORIENTATION=-
MTWLMNVGTEWDPGPHQCSPSALTDGSTALRAAVSTATSMKVTPWGVSSRSAILSLSLNSRQSYKSPPSLEEVEGVEGGRPTQNTSISRSLRRPRSGPTLSSISSYVLLEFSSP